MIALYNTLTRKKEEFRPLTEGMINMYVCGPTVYDVPHIGHARSALAFDVIRRFFEYSGYEVNMVRNITDVDDKIINKAIAELEELGKGVDASTLKKRSEEVAGRYLQIYHRELEVLGLRPPDSEPRATRNIDRMISFIERLIEKGHAYVAGHNVYFSIQSYPDYGKLSHQDIDQMMHGVRIEVDGTKKHPLDFALWKEAKPQEPSWTSPWGEGRPGWHIECSVMSTGIFGPRFDIHGGGLDLIFPHHENEIAQAEAGTGEPFANYWLHNGLLTVNGEKMSKSLGNFMTISDFLERYKDPDLLKIAFLMSQYRSPMDYSEEKINEAARSKERIMIFLDRVERLDKENGRGAPPAEALSAAQETSSRLRENFLEAMNDDFNTASALSVIFEAVHKGNEVLSDDNMSAEEKACIAKAVKNQILMFAEVLCLKLDPVKVDDSEAEEIDKMLKLRQEARKKKDFGESDRIRDELLARGIVVEDTPEGPVWRKK
ncbi:MAG: cysteine--tRNA ligase [Candidatus Omnitrophica bacterium]|nr:cysteine--tRNA ligase [Candidatus Omnitrophota bacterium]